MWTNISTKIKCPRGDCLHTKCGFWKDDALVCSEIIEKFWAMRQGIYIRIEEVEKWQRSTEPSSSAISPNLT